MRDIGLVLTASILFCGCVSNSLPMQENPLRISAGSYDILWEKTIDVIDDYFVIVEENRTDGKIITLPKVGATLLEPWHHEAVNFEERLEGTFQTIRRQAVIQISASATGYSLDIKIRKELEDLLQPERATSGTAMFRSNPELRDKQEVVTENAPDEGWIEIGRDFALEQEILAQLQYRLSI